MPFLCLAVLAYGSLLIEKSQQSNKQKSTVCFEVRALIQFFNISLYYLKPLPPFYSPFERSGDRTIATIVVVCPCLVLYRCIPDHPSGMIGNTLNENPSVF
jgi:hypothetical protein